MPSTLHVRQHQEVCINAYHDYHDYHDCQHYQDFCDSMAHFERVFNLSVSRATVAVVVLPFTSYNSQANTPPPGQIFGALGQASFNVVNPGQQANTRCVKPSRRRH